MLYDENDVKNETFKEGIVSILRQNKVENIAESTLKQVFPIRANYLYASKLVKNGSITMSDIYSYTLSRKLKNSHCEDYKYFITIEDAENFYKDELLLNKYSIIKSYNNIVNLKTREVVKTIKESE